MINGLDIPSPIVPQINGKFKHSSIRILEKSIEEILFALIPNRSFFICHMIQKIIYHCRLSFRSPLKELYSASVKSLYGCRPLCVQLYPSGAVSAIGFLLSTPDRGFIPARHIGSDYRVSSGMGTLSSAVWVNDSSQSVCRPTETLSALRSFSSATGFGAVSKR